MSEALPSLLVIVVGVAVNAGLTTTMGGARAWLWGAFALHIVAAILMVWITRDYYGYGDMLAYHRTGVRLASQSFVDGVGDVVLMFFHQPNGIVGVHGNGWSTGSIHALATVLAWLLDGSLMASCIALSLLSYSGKVALWRGMVQVFPAHLSRRLFAACLLFPSAVFWTSGILKETVAVTGLGWMVLALADVASGRRRAIVLVVAAMGALLVGLTKAYVLFVFAIAAGVAFVVSRASVQRSMGVRLARLAAAVVGVAVLVVGLGVLFPRYSTENLSEEVSSLRELGRTHAGGSTIVDDSGPIGSAHLLGALVTSLFRPFLFEVRNPLMLVGAAETTMLLVLVIFSVRRGGIKRIMKVVRTHPGLAFCFTFTIAFAVGVGVSSTNLGTLSRYRVPMLPFYAAGVLSLSARGARRQAVHPRPAASKQHRPRALDLRPASGV